MSKELIESSTVESNVSEHITAKCHDINKVIKHFLLNPNLYTKNTIESLLSDINEITRILETFYSRNYILNINEIKRELFKALTVHYNLLGDKIYSYLYDISKYGNYNSDISELYKLFTQELPFPSNDKKLLFTIEAVRFKKIYSELNSHIKNYDPNISIIEQVNSDTTGTETLSNTLVKSVIDTTEQQTKSMELINAVSRDNIYHYKPCDYTYAKITQSCKEINKTLEAFIENPNIYTKDMIENLLLNTNEFNKQLEDFCKNITRLNKIEIKKCLLTELKNLCDVFVDTLFNNLDSVSTIPNDIKIGQLDFLLDQNLQLQPNNEKLILTLENTMFHINCSKLNFYFQSHITLLQQSINTISPELDHQEITESPEKHSTEIINSMTSSLTDPPSVFVTSTTSENNLFINQHNTHITDSKYNDLTHDLTNDIFNHPVRHRYSISSMGSFSLEEPLPSGVDNEDHYIASHYRQRNTSGSFSIIDPIGQHTNGKNNSDSHKNNNHKMSNSYHIMHSSYHPIIQEEETPASGVNLNTDSISN